MVIRRSAARSLFRLFTCNKCNCFFTAYVAKDRFSLKWCEVCWSASVSSSGVTVYFNDSKVVLPPLPFFFFFLKHFCHRIPYSNSLDRIHQKWKAEHLMWICHLKTNKQTKKKPIRRSLLVCRCHSKGSGNFLKRSFDLEPDLMWTKTEYTKSPI